MLFFRHYLNQPAITKFVAADLYKSVGKSCCGIVYIFLKK